MSEIVLDNVGLVSNSTQILENINETIFRGELYCILGTSGSGKSTLLKVINGLLIEIEGKVIVQGKSIYNYSPKEMLNYHNRCGFVFQTSALISNMTVFDNLALCFQYHTNLTKIEIFEKIEPHLAYFDVDTTILEQRPAFLSNGEKQIFGIIRALLRDPEYRFWDQPLSSLDHIYQNRVQKLIEKSRDEGKTTILVSNHPKYALKVADRIGILHQGRLIASETPRVIKKTKDSIIKRLIQS
ncbi:MAG: ATP-binding cassette domain-containing protein [Leptospirales bacterium]